VTCRCGEGAARRGREVSSPRAGRPSRMRGAEFARDRGADPRAHSVVHLQIVRVLGFVLKGAPTLPVLARSTREAEASETSALATLQKRGAGSSAPSSRSDSRDSERAAKCPRNRSVPRHDGARWSPSRSLACRALGVFPRDR
jgi:hypothetical protein